MRKILIFLLCFCTLFLCFVIPSFADATATASYSISGNWVINDVTDLYPYTSISFTSNDKQYIGIAVEGGTLSKNLRYYYDGGYDVVTDGITGIQGSTTWVNDAYRFLDFGSSSQDVSESFYSMFTTDATFTAPQPETSSIAGGIYHFKQFSDLPDIPDAGWSDGEGYTYSYSVAGKMVTTSRNYNFTTFNVTFDEYVSNSYYTVTFSVDTDIGILDLATYTASYGQIELQTRSDLKYIVFDEALIGTYDDIEFMRQFLVSGLPGTDTSPTDNPWLYILEMIIEALKVDLFGYFSVWDIFTTICGIFIVTWLLKLLAGG